MRANDPKAKVPANGRPWLDACRLLLDRDGRSVDEVEQVIRFTQADEFERTVVLSMPKLRERFPGLLLKAQRTELATRSAEVRAAFEGRSPTRGTKRPSAEERAAALEAMAAELEASERGAA